MAAESTGSVAPTALAGRRAEEALPALMAQLGKRIFSLSLKFCGNREDAEDLVQETFLQAFRKWDQFEGRASPTSWLYTIAARGCQRMNRLRSGEPARMSSLDEPLASGLSLGARIPSAKEGAVEEELRREAVEIVDRGLAGLPVEYRLPLVLKEIAELSLREIAEILGLKEATVKTRVHRGRLALRAQLTRELGTETVATAGHVQQVCLDLLRSKLEAMDRGVPFPVHEQELCDRCRDFVRSLDLTAEACRWVRGGELPDSVRRTLEAQFRR